MACCAKLAERIRKRDGETCSICGKPHDLDVHHVIPSYKGGSDDVHNLITLCHKCHLNKHRELNQIREQLPDIPAFLGEHNREIATRPKYARIDSNGKVYLDKRMAGKEVLVIAVKPVPEDKIRYIKVGR